MEKEKILKESKKDQTVNDKGVVSSSLLDCRLVFGKGDISVAHIEKNKIQGVVFEPGKGTGTIGGTPFDRKKGTKLYDLKKAVVFEFHNKESVDIVIEALENAKAAIPNKGINVHEFVRCTSAKSCIGFYDKCSHIVEHKHTVECTLRCHYHKSLTLLNSYCNSI